MKATCIDVSVWQGADIDFAKVKAAGIEAVIIRAGFGNTGTDKYFYTNYSKAKAAGLKIGAYWYSKAGGVNPVESAKAEAAKCLQVIHGKTFELPIYYDLEESSTASHGYTVCTNIATTFCEAIIKGGYRAGIYANGNWFTNYLDYNALAKKYSIWYARPGTTCSRTCDIWQNCWTARINGISVDVDTDIIMNRAIIQGGGTQPAENPADQNVESGKESIKAVQKWLNSNYGTKLMIDGVYGNLTRVALSKALQVALNRAYSARLVVDGVFGQKTYSAIRNIKKGTNGEITRVLQGLLICHGYDTGGFDGVYGSKTESAVKDYQKANSLTVDGIAGRNTFKALCTR